MNELHARRTEEEEREAERFAAALDALDSGRSLPVAPLDAPVLYEDLRAAARIRDAAQEIEPRLAYRARSRALLIEAAVPLARRHDRGRAVFTRPSFLVPFASAAAAAGLTIGAVLGASSLGYGPGGTTVATSTEATVAANLTRRSIQEDLRTLQAALDAVVAADARGDALDLALLRSISETTLSVTALIEASPQSVRNEDVILYFQAAAATNIKLGEIAPRVAATPGSAPEVRSVLGTAQRASEDAVFASSKRIKAIEEELASNPRP